MKALFDGFGSADGGIINDRETALQYIVEIELPVCLNLAFCYLKLQMYHYCIKYCCQVLDKDSENDKALFRRGVAYMNVGELNKASEDLTRANQLTEGKDPHVIEMLHELKAKRAQAFEKE